MPPVAATLRQLAAIDQADQDEQALVGGEPARYPTLASIDLGSNSFRMMMGRVEGDQVYPLQTLKEPVRLGAGLDANGALTEDALARAIACLERFGERLRDMPATAVRAVGTNTLRVATNVAKVLPKLERALGYPIEVVAGREEARLVYQGVAHTLPPTPGNRLVFDIGGGSTEFIIGAGYEPRLVESLKIGCVTWSLRFFNDGKLTKSRLRDAQIAARSEIEEIADTYRRAGWAAAYGSSGTSRALVEIIEQNGFSAGGITPAGLDGLRDAMLSAGHISRLKLAALRPERAPVLAGGFAIMAAIVTELGLDHVQPAEGALRLGVLYDLLGRGREADIRAASVRTLAKRHGIDLAQASRVAHDAIALLDLLAPDADAAAQHQLAWVAWLHEVGGAISHGNYHKHTAYILENADLPGFSTQDQRLLAQIALAQRGNLKKVVGSLANPTFQAQVLALRLALIFRHGRRDFELPPLTIAGEDRLKLQVPASWLAEHPLTAYLLSQESAAWAEVGRPISITA